MSEVSVVEGPRAAALAAAELFTEAAAGAAAARGKALVALTGGSSAPALYEALRAPPWRDRVPWDKVHLFTGDERRVPVDDPLSNWGVAARELLPHVPVAPERQHRMRGEAPDAEAEAARLAGELRALAAPAGASPGTPPRLDLLLLGLGSDGHLLSLFAGVESSGLRGDAALVRAVDAPLAVEPKVSRLTMTPFLILTARTVVVQVSGGAKAAVLARALRGPEDLVACPGQWLRRASGRVVVVADAAAAAGL